MIAVPYYMFQKSIDYNLKALYDVYRTANGIIPLEHIMAIPEKYAIGKRPLSLLLGWGEQTFSRYYDGDIPTKQYSDMLTRLYRPCILFRNIRSREKTALNPLPLMKKSRKTVDTLLGRGLDTANESKISIAIRYLLNRCEDITPLALQKALYYIQGFYNAFYHTFLFSEEL